MKKFLQFSLSLFLFLMPSCIKHATDSIHKSKTCLYILFSNKSLFHKEDCKTFMKDIISSVLSVVSKGVSSTDCNVQLIKYKKCSCFKRNQMRCQYLKQNQVH